MSSEHAGRQRLRPDEKEAASIRRILRIAREHLDMDVSFVAESDGRILEWSGGGDLIDEQPEHRQPQLFELPEPQRDLNANAISAPVVLAGGRRCGLLRAPGRSDPSTADRDAQLLRLLAGLASEGLSAELGQRERALAQLERVVDLLEASDLTMVFQPITWLNSGAVMGFEALARFSGDPHRPPQAWFAEAGQVGLGVDLEMKALSSALAVLSDIPPPLFLSVNVSAPTLCSPELDSALRGVDPARVQFELTEHELVEDYEHVNHAITALRACGFRLAIDDAGAGYAGLTHILSLAPDVIKLDRAIIRSIDRDHARQALASSLVAFSQRTGTDIVAEGIETQAEVDALLALGVSIGQGYHLARPSSRPWRALVAR